MEIIGHRGASHDAPENTLAAVHLAWTQGADAAEIDVQLSKDDRLVVIHDATTRRTTGVPRKVSSLTLAELNQLDAGSWKGHAWRQEPVPGLADVLAIVPKDKRLLIEIKCGPACLPDLERCLQRSGLKPRQVIPIGFDLDLMRAVKQRLPRFPVYWVVAFARRRASWNPRWVPGPTDVVTRARSAGLDGLDVSAKAPWSERWVRHLHRAGLGLFVWTVDDPILGAELKTLGVDGLTTNRPDWMRRQLARHNPVP